MSEIGGVGDTLGESPLRRTYVEVKNDATKLKH